MKIFAISDLHLSINNPKPMNIFGEAWDNYLDKIKEDWQEKVSDDDIVLLAGDFSWAMKLEDAVADFNELKEFKGKKIIIKGNHDYWWKSITAVRNILPENFYAIQNDALKFGDKIICGTRGWTVPENDSFVEGSDDDKLYKRETLRLEMTLREAKRLQSENEEIICLMHYPPFNKHRKDTNFTRLFEKENIKKVVYGHLHAYGKEQLVVNKNGITYYLTSCDLLENKLIEIV